MSDEERDLRGDSAQKLGKAALNMMDTMTEAGQLAAGWEVDEVLIVCALRHPESGATAWAMHGTDPREWIQGRILEAGMNMVTSRHVQRAKQAGLEEGLFGAPGQEEEPDGDE